MHRKIKKENLAGIIILIFSVTGVLSSLMLSIERINYLKNPNQHLLCAINSTFNCNSVMNAPEAEIFGFPNSLLGLIGYSMFISYGVFLMFNNTKINKLIESIYLIGSLIAFIFSYWLMYVSVFLIESLCIYCILSCISATNIFFGTLYLKIFTDDNTKIKIKKYYLNQKTYLIGILLWYLFIFIIGFINTQS